MKRRLLLSCVSCLLALGLVSACNNEEDVDLNGDDGTTQNDGGGSGSGSGDNTGAVTTLSNYTLSFAFVDEEGEALAIPSWGLISIQGSWDGWKGWISLTPEEDGTYTYTFDSIKVGTYEYTGVLWYADEDPVWTIKVVTDASAFNGNCTLTVTGTEGDNYTAPTVTLTITEEQLALLPEEKVPVVTLSNYTLTFVFMAGETEDTVPDGATVYISYGPTGSAWGDFIALDTNNSVIFETIDTGSYSYKLVIYDGEDNVSWDNSVEITTSDQTFVVSEEDDGGQSITITSSHTLEEILSGTTASAVGTISVTIALENTEEVETYEGSTGTELTWYFDGFEWMNAGADYKAQRTLSAYEGVEYNYDCSITVENVDLSTDYTFNIAPYEWQNDFGTIGLAPADSLTLEWSEDNFYLWGEQYKAGTDTTDYTDYTWAGWGLGFSNLTSGSVLETATNLTIVMQLDFSKVSNTTNSDTNSLVTGVYFLVDGVSTAE